MTYTEWFAVLLKHWSQQVICMQVKLFACSMRRVQGIGVKGGGLGQLEEERSLRLRVGMRAFPLFGFYFVELILVQFF